MSLQTLYELYEWVVRIFAVLLAAVCLLSFLVIGIDRVLHGRPPPAKRLPAKQMLKQMGKSLVWILVLWGLFAWIKHLLTTP
jgi:hypothetical protein